ADQTRLINRTRALLAEHGVVIPEGKARFGSTVAALLEGDENSLPWRLRQLLGRQYQQYRLWEEELAWYTQEIERHAEQDEVCQKLLSGPGFRPIRSRAF